MQTEEVDILAFGAHADDVEIGMGGTIAKYTELGKKVVICDLTKAEMSSNGTVESRLKEAEKACRVLGVAKRVNAGLPDRGLFLTPEHIEMVAGIIRKYKPKVIFAPYPVDRHPDHGNCAKLVEEASFSAGVRKFRDSEQQDPHKAEAIYYFMINGFHKPDFAVDISGQIHQKISSLESYSSQFKVKEGTFQTPLVGDYIDSVVSREKMIGKEVGVDYAEGFFSTKPLLLSEDLLGGRK
ncbi:bacillithiol biosynthesis deacetylase BshB1 [Bacillus testis]|uniref:bacillithiol biosynthesis deacetylase BshB1 n=1 Tax=Bacillus testis TaxID=1622072 RepID=UPI00067EB43F|nr:bacillithiol biosynthesis deacetylase BshB1 [Bacillus testis]